ncbi:carcinoembryonic antigen-related cell adhesion molecule 3-like [Sigmodon hispidus]
MLAIRNPLEKKPTEWGPAYSRREILRPDGSLLITRVSQKDHGSYILKIIKRDMKVAEARVQLQVDASRSLLCHPLISSKLVIQPVPQSVAEGKAVLLQVYNLPEDWRAFFWYKSKDEIPVLKIVDHNRAIKSISWGPEQRSGMVYNNGSLVLQDVIGEDEGIYILEVLNKDFNIEKAYVELNVNKNVRRPIVKVTDNRFRGGTSVIFTCVSRDTDISTRWIFNYTNLELTERMTLSPTKCGLKIDPFMKEDTGVYQCEVSNQFSLKTSFPVFWP